MRLIANLLIEALELHAYHGWYPHEGEFGQPFSIDLEIAADISAEASSDRLGAALDYAAVVASTRRLFVETRHKLIEAAAVALGNGLLTEFPKIERIVVRVRKLKPPIPERLAAVGVEVTLTRADL
ncbi:MAG TPA: dihydroneopterin aldolase [Beijerinckiaceae bacterium]|nr:dihydroneopterin aldolase [Beijerinckiaceae bacterium]